MKLLNNILEASILSKCILSLWGDIVNFFNSPQWTPIGNFFTFLGIISPIFLFFRFLHNCKHKEWKDNVAIYNYDNDYDVEANEMSPIYSKVWDEQSPYAGIIVFKPSNCIITKLEIILLNLETQKAERVIETFKNVSPDTPVCLKIERAEALPQYRLRWYSDYGEYYDYNLEENRRTGINDITGVIYKNNFITTIRKLFEWK